LVSDRVGLGGAKSAPFTQGQPHASRFCAPASSVFEAFLPKRALRRALRVRQRTPKRFNPHLYQTGSDLPAGRGYSGQSGEPLIEIAHMHHATWVMATETRCNENATPCSACAQRPGTRVVVMEACPRRWWTSFGWTPRPSSRVAQVCLRSCQRISWRSSCLSNGLK